MVLEYWAVRKKQQDACMQFVQYEASAKQVCNIHHLTSLTTALASLQSSIRMLSLLNSPLPPHPLPHLPSLLWTHCKKLRVVCSC